MLANYKEILEKTKSRVVALGEDIIKAYNMTLDACEKDDPAPATEARSLLKDAHNRNNKIDNEILKTLALFSPEAKDLRVMIAYLKIASELSRIADYIRSFAKKVKMQISSELDLSPLKSDMHSFLESTRASLEAAVSAIEAETDEVLENLYRKVNVEESKCDDIVSVLEKNIIQQICIDPEEAGEMVEFLKGMRKLERISDRSVNIVKLAYFAKKGGKLKL